MRKIEIKKQYIVAGLLFIIAIVTVGYAILRSNLNISGTVTTKSNSWSVHFNNVQMNQESVNKTAPTISNGTSLNFNVELAMPGDLYGFTVDAVNDGTIDAKIGNVSISNLTTEQAKLIDLSITYNDGTQIQQNDALKANSTKRIKVLVKYKDDINPADLPNNNVSINVTFAVDYVQADENAKNVNSITVNATNEAGDNINATASEITGSEKTNLLNSLEESGLINSASDVDALIEVESDNFEGIARTTFDVSSIANDGDKVVILHFDKTKQEWEYIGTEIVNNGRINGDFTSYSPIVFVKLKENGEFEIIEQKVYKIVNDANGNGIVDVGDEIVINGTDEHFYAFSNNDGKIAALAKYNLNVGYIYDSSTSEYKLIENPTGIQDSVNNTKMRLSDSNNQTWNHGEDGVEEKAIGLLHDTLVNYKTILPEGTIVRLITKTELERLGCTESGNYCRNAPSWVYSTSYWTGSSYPSSITGYAGGVWGVFKGGNFNSNFFTSYDLYGLRPVIEIPA